MSLTLVGDECWLSRANILELSRTSGSHTLPRILKEDGKPEMINKYFLYVLKSTMTALRVYFFLKNATLLKIIGSYFVEFLL